LKHNSDIASAVQTCILDKGPCSSIQVVNAVRAMLSPSPNKTEIIESLYRLEGQGDIHRDRAGAWVHKNGIRKPACKNVTTPKKQSEHKKRRPHLRKISLSPKKLVTVGRAQNATRNG